MFQTLNERPGLEVINKAHFALYFEFENVLKFYNLEAWFHPVYEKNQQYQNSLASLVNYSKWLDLSELSFVWEFLFVALEYKNQVHLLIWRIYFIWKEVGMKTFDFYMRVRQI